jgi:hypothetical protein
VTALCTIARYIYQAPAINQHHQRRGVFSLLQEELDEHGQGKWEGNEMVCFHSIKFVVVGPTPTPSSIELD